MQQEHGQSEIAVPQGKGKAVLFSLLILFSGVIIGSGLTLITMSRLRPKPTEQGWERASEHMIRRMVGELELGPEQQQLLVPIVQRHMKAMDDLRQEARPKFAAEMKMMNEEILSVLDENQQILWKDKMDEMRRRFSRSNREGRGGRGGPGRDGEHRPGDGRGRRDGTGQGPGSRMGPEGGMRPRRTPDMESENERPPHLGPEGEFPPEHQPPHEPKPDAVPHEPNQMQPK